VKSRDIRTSDAQSLADMMNLDADGPEPWNPEDLGTILEHQLLVPVASDVGGLGKQLAGRPDLVRSLQDLGITSFNDLLHHPRPPVELLKLTKEFAKDCRSHADSPLPDEIATILYFLSIVVAMQKCTQRISQLNHAGLRYGLDWALEQTWLDAPTRKLLEDGRRAVDAEQSG